MERMPSIFNDVLSPVTPGPSSSNTCGPYRIARLARALLGEPPRRITVRMARRGGYYDTFYSMHSHEAILAALLGQELLRCDLSTMCRQADEAGLSYDFQFVDDLPVRPSELAEMELSGDRRTIRLTGVSLGGGEIEITRLNGSDILLRGKRRETVCLGPEGARVVPEDTAAGPGQWLARLEPLFPFPQQEGTIPFRTAQEMFALPVTPGVRCGGWLSTMKVPSPAPRRRSCGPTPGRCWISAAMHGSRASARTTTLSVSPTPVPPAIRLCGRGGSSSIWGPPMRRVWTP